MHPDDRPPASKAARAARPDATGGTWGPCKDRFAVFFLVWIFPYLACVMLAGGAGLALAFLLTVVLALVFFYDVFPPLYYPHLRAAVLGLAVLVLLVT